MYLIKKVISSISNFTEKIAVSICLAGVAALTLNLIIAVFFRYVFKAPIYFANELALYLFSLITFFGGSIGVKKTGLASVTILIDKLRGLPKKILLIFIQINILAFGIVILYYSLIWITSPNILAQMASTISIPMWLPYSIIPLSMICIIIFSLDNLLKLVLERGSQDV